MIVAVALLRLISVTVGWLRLVVSVDWLICGRSTFIGGLLFRVSALSMVVAGCCVEDEWNLGFTALKERYTGTDHVFCPRELLAVEDEGVLVIVEVRRGKAAQVARCVDLGGRVVECGHVAGLVHVGRLVAGTDHRVASRDPRVERGGVIAQVPDGRLEGLKSDENLGLHLDSLHIVVLVPDLLVLPELVDLLVEISAG